MRHTHTLSLSQRAQYAGTRTKLCYDGRQQTFFSHFQKQKYKQV